MKRTAIPALAIAAAAVIACAVDRDPLEGSSAGVHPSGIADPASPDFHAQKLRARSWAAMLDPDDGEACGRCHDGALSRPPGVHTNAPGATRCTQCHAEPGGVLACSTCHGDGKARAYPDTGAHRAHVESSATHTTGLACATCHPTPSPERVIAGPHGDGAVEIAFDPTRVRPEASFDAAAKRCAVGCHDRGGTRARPVWSDHGPLACGDCHGAPPANHHPGSCTTCHHEANATGTALGPGALHMNGTVDLGDGSGKCGACHGNGDSPWPTSKVHQAHANPTLTTPIACATCHPVPEAITSPGHMDGVVQVTFTGRALARGASPTWNGATCAEVACHGANLPEPAAVPAWRDTSGREATCGACHGVPPAQQHTTSTSCDRAACHGNEVGLGPTILGVGRAKHIDGVVASDR